MANESLQLGLLLLAALGLGALLPVLFLLAGTLRELRSRLKTSGPKLDQVIEKAQVVADRLERSTQDLQAKEQAVDDVLQAGRELAESVEGIKRSLNLARAVGNSVGPAVAAFLSVMRENGGRDRAEAPADEHAVPEGVRTEAIDQGGEP